MAVIPYSDLPAGSIVGIKKDPVTGWPARYSSRADLIFFWIGPTPAPTLVTSGTGGMIDGSDEFLETP